MHESFILRTEHDYWRMYVDLYLCESSRTYPVWKIHSSLYVKHCWYPSIQITNDVPESSLALVYPSPYPSYISARNAASLHGSAYIDKYI